MLTHCRVSVSKQTVRKGTKWYNVWSLCGVFWNCLCESAKKHLKFQWACVVVAKLKVLELVLIMWGHIGSIYKKLTCVVSFSEEA